MHLPIEILFQIFECIIDDRYRTRDKYLVLYHILRISRYFQNLCSKYMKNESLRYLKEYEGNVDHIDHNQLYWPNIYKELYYIQRLHGSLKKKISKFYILVKDRSYSIICHVHPMDHYGECDFKTIVSGIMSSAIQSENNRIVSIDRSLWNSCQKLLHSMYHLDVPIPSIGDEVKIDIPINQIKYFKMSRVNTSVQCKSLPYSLVFTTKQLSLIKDNIIQILESQFRSCYHEISYVDRFNGEYETFHDSWTDELYDRYKSVLQMVQ